MNVYDFDGTIYRGDSTINFFIFCIKKKPVLVFHFLKQFVYCFSYVLKINSKTEVKQKIFSFLPKIDTDEYVELFWKKHEVKIEEWYLKQQKEDDVIISASPDFLLKPICKSLGIKFLIASEVDYQTGLFLRENCYGKEKVNRFKEKFDICKIDKFYSDSKSDEPLAKVAKEAYMVKKGKIVRWPNEN